MVPVHQCIPAAIATLLKRQPYSDAKLLFAWRTAVGPAIDRATRVRLVGRATLVVEAADQHWQAEVERAQPLILARLETLLGESVVKRLSVIVGGTRPMPRLHPDFDHQP
jgi:hypothetical protein